MGVGGKVFLSATLLEVQTKDIGTRLRHRQNADGDGGANDGDNDDSSDSADSTATLVLGKRLKNQK